MVSISILIGGCNYVQSRLVRSFIDMYGQNSVLIIIVVAMSNYLVPLRM